VQEGKNAMGRRYTLAQRITVVACSLHTEDMRRFAERELAITTLNPY